MDDTDDEGIFSEDETPPEPDAPPEPDRAPEPDVPPEPDDDDFRIDRGLQPSGLEQQETDWWIICIFFFAYFGIYWLMFYLEYSQPQNKQVELFDRPINDTIQSETCRNPHKSAKDETNVNPPVISLDTKHLVDIQHNFGTLPQASCKVFDAKKECEEWTQLYGPPGATAEFYSGITSMRFKRNGTYVYQYTCIDSYGQETFGFPVVMTSFLPYVLKVDVRGDILSATVIKSDYHGLQDVIFYHNPSVNSSNFDEKSSKLNKFTVITYTYDGHTASSYLCEFGLRKPEVNFSNTPKVDGYDREGIKRFPKQKEAIAMFLRNLVMHGPPLSTNTRGLKPTELSQVFIVPESANDIFKSLTNMDVPIAGVYILKYPESSSIFQHTQEAMARVVEVERTTKALLKRLEMPKMEVGILKELFEREAERKMQEKILEEIGERREQEKILEEIAERHVRMFNDLQVGRPPAHR